MYAFLGAFTGRVWVLVFFTAIVSSVVLRTLDQYSPYGFYKCTNTDTHGHERDLNMANSLYAMLGVLFGGGVTPARNWAGRLLQLGYMFFAVLIISSYTASLASQLTDPQRHAHLHLLVGRHPSEGR